MEDEIRNVIANLESLLPHISGLAEVESDHESAKAELAATQTKLAAVKAELGKATAGMTSAQLVAKKKHDEEIYAKQQELTGLGTSITDAKNRLGELQAEISSKLLQHNQILDGINSLRKKLA